MITHKLTSVNLQDELFANGLTINLIINSLITELGLEDITIVDKDIFQNWLYADRVARVTILTSTIVSNSIPISVIDGVEVFSELHNLIERVKKDHFGYYKNNSKDKCLIIYLNGVESEDYAIIAPLVGTEIWIENKII